MQVDPIAAQTSVKFVPVVPGSPLTYDQGLTKRTHKSGLEIFMVKNEPGVYLNAYGKEVPEALAKEAGFDTVKFGKEKRKRELMAKATEEIRAQLAKEDDTAPEDFAVLREKNGYKVVDMNLGRAIIRDPDGNNLLPMPVPHEQALGLLDKLVLDAPAEE